MEKEIRMLERKSNEETILIVEELQQIISNKLIPLNNLDSLVITGMLIEDLLGALIATGPVELYKAVLERAAECAKEISDKQKEI